MEPTREQAWETLTRYTKSEPLLRHALAVEASTASYARKFGEDEELWRGRRLLHDFDYEMHPTSTSIRRTALRSCARRLSRRGRRHGALARRAPRTAARHAVEEGTLRLRRAERLRARLRARAPDRARGLEPKSVKKKLKQPSFAAGVHREDVYKRSGGARRRPRRPHPHRRRGVQPISNAAEFSLTSSARTTRLRTPSERRRSSSLVHQPHETHEDCVQGAPDEHALLGERRHELQRIAVRAERDERRVAGRRHDVHEWREQLAAASAAAAPPRSATPDAHRAPPRCRRAQAPIQPESNRLAPSFGTNEPSAS